MLNPDTVLSVKSVQRLQWYTAAWFVIRADWIRAVWHSTEPLEISSGRRWKTFLMGFYRNQDNGIHTTVNTIPSNSQRPMLDVLQLQYMPTINSDNYEFTWNGLTHKGKLDMILTLDVVRQVIWELFYMNFRLELSQLHSYFHPTYSRAVIEDQVSKCFPTDYTDPAIHVLSTNTGLASNDWGNRAPFMSSFCKLLATWPGEKPPRITEASIGPSSNQTSALAHEKQAIMFYYDIFTRVFNRNPIMLYVCPR